MIIMESDYIPRPGSPLYNLTLADEDVKTKTLKKWAKLNKWFMVPLYRIKLLPLFGFGKIFLMLITRGRVSGKKRRTPLEYHKIDGVITVFSARGADASARLPKKFALPQRLPSLPVVRENVASVLRDLQGRAHLTASVRATVLRFFGLQRSGLNGRRPANRPAAPTSVREGR